MRSWVDSVSAGALLALSAAFAGVPIVATASPASIEAAIPVPEPANLPPPSIADFAPQPTSTPSSGPAPHSPAPSASPAAGDPATTATVTPEPVSPAVRAEPAPPPAADDESISRGVPIPEPANVPPPTAADVGPLQLAPPDQRVADRMRDLIEDGLHRLVDGKAERTALQAFYKARFYAPIWVEYGAPSGKMKAAIVRLRAADADGLDASDYYAPDLKALAADPEAIAQAELRLSAALLAFARHAQAGRVTVSRISPNMDFSPPVPEPVDVLKGLAEAKDVAAAMDAFNPPHAGFRLLKAKLAELRGKPEDAIVQIPSGPSLKRGMKDKRVPLLRQRLKIEGDADDIVYDKAVADAVKEFQRSKKMKATGALTQATVDALNGRSRSRDIDVVISNMERWRWLPRDLGQAYVMVNVPDFTLRTVRDGKTVFHTRIVVGKPNTPSPQFSGAIENILVNPSWHVPQSIIYGEYLPALERDPSVLARMGLQVTRNRDGSISIRQPPGERNALGRIKFNFPNKFHVYLHDTPTKNLFAHDRRAYSHGCMRVQNPAQFAEVLLSIALPRERYTAERIASLYGKGEHWIKFPTNKKIPVHLVYMNAYVDEAGKLIIRDDVYGYDKRVQAALRGQYMAIAERSQVVTGGPPRRASRPRQVVEQQRPQRPAFPWFFNPFFRDHTGL